MCYNTITGSAPSYLSGLLHLYSPSRSLCSSSLKIQRFNCKTHGFRTFSHFGPHIWNNLPPRHQALCYSLPSKANSRHFSSLNISVKPHCPSLLSVCTVCVCVRACVCVLCVHVHLLHNYAWTLVDIYIFIFWDNISISMYIMCVCLFSALSRRVGALQISNIIMLMYFD